MLKGYPIFIIGIEDTNEKVKQIAKTVNGPNFAPQGKIAMKAQAEIIALD